MSIGRFCKANGLVRVGICWRDGCHGDKSHLQCNPRIFLGCAQVTVIIVGVHESANETHDQNTMLQASMTYLSDEIIQYTVFTRVELGVPPKRAEDVGKERAPVIMGQAVWLTGAPHSA